MTRFGVLAVLVSCSGFVACSAQGGGVGELKTASGVRDPRLAPVRFSWRSEGPSVTRGTMSATVPGKGYFEGKYMQPVARSDLVETTPYFQGLWYPGWGVWDGWGASWDQFIINYSGKVIAVLRSEDGESMRCRFHLAEPASGPAGGGIGECELWNGDRVNDVVLEEH